VNFHEGIETLDTWIIYCFHRYGLTGNHIVNRFILVYSEVVVKS